MAVNYLSVNLVYLSICLCIYHFYPSLCKSFKTIIYQSITQSHALFLSINCLSLNLFYLTIYLLIYLIIYLWHQPSLYKSFKPTLHHSITLVHALLLSVLNAHHSICSPYLRCCLPVCVLHLSVLSVYYKCITVISSLSALHSSAHSSLSEIAVGVFF